MNLSQFLYQLEYDGRIPGRIIYAKLWGSRSHNTHLPASDYDFCGVYAVDTKDILSRLNEPKDTVEQEHQGERDLGVHSTQMAENQKPDFQFHEARKFCFLLLKGNPGILEMLFTDRDQHSTPIFDELREHRREFLSQQAVKSYLGYAQGQLQKLEKSQGKGGLHTKGGAYSEKWAYHLMRLVRDARAVAIGHEPLVWKSADSFERDLLMEIRGGRMAWPDIQYMANDIVGEIEKAKPWPLPEHGNKELLEKWLLKLRMEGL